MPLLQLKSGADYLSDFFINSFWCFDLFMLIWKGISSAQVLYLPSLQKYVLGPRCPYVSLPALHCPAQLLSERNIFHLFKYLQLRLWFYDGPKSTEVEPVSPNLGHAFQILFFCNLYYTSWCSMNQFSKLICLKTIPKIRRNDGFLTGLISWFIRVIQALTQDWWWEHAAGDNQEKRDMNISDSARLPFGWLK